MSNQLNKRYVIKSLKYFKRLLEFELIHSFLTIFMTKGQSKSSKYFLRVRPFQN